MQVSVPPKLITLDAVHSTELMQAVRLCNASSGAVGGDVGLWVCMDTGAGASVYDHCAVGIQCSLHH